MVSHLQRSVGTLVPLILVGDGVGVGEGDPEKQPDELPEEPNEQLDEAQEGVGDGEHLTGAETGTKIFLTVTVGIADVM